MIIARLDEGIFADKAELSLLASYVASEVVKGSKVILVHDGGNLIGRALSDAGFDYQEQDGVRTITPKAMPTITKVVEGINDAISDAIKGALRDSGSVGKVLQTGTATGSPIVYGKPTGKFDKDCNGELDHVDQRVLGYDIGKADVMIISSLARFESTNDFGFVNVDATQIAIAVASAMVKSCDVIFTRPQPSDLEFCAKG